MLSASQRCPVSARGKAGSEDAGHAGPAVSVLVPIYNVERYLRQCLDSLCGQTLRDLEVVCIDDGSTDSSASIVREYAARDPRVRVVSKANSGYGDSMNRGIAEARGRWIGICEPDDFCDIRMFEELLDVAERFGCDFVKSNYCEHQDGEGDGGSRNGSDANESNVAGSAGSAGDPSLLASMDNREDDGDGNQLHNRLAAQGESEGGPLASKFAVLAHGIDACRAHLAELTATHRDPLHEVFGGFPYGKVLDPREVPELLYTDPTIWTGLYRADFLRENAISFSQTPGASFQDASFAHLCWMSARRVVLLRRGFYHYRIDNATSSVKSGAKVFAVCDEYDRSLTFARTRGGESWRVFGPRLTILRFGVYVWNYNRIAQEFRPEFVRRWMGEIVQADDEGLLDVTLMTREYRTLLADVLEGPEALCRKYPGDIPPPPLR